MAARLLAALSVFWLVAWLPASEAQAAAEGCPPEAQRCLERWQSAILALAEWPLQVTYDPASGAVEFTGMEGERRPAMITGYGKVSGPVGGVLHLVESASWPPPSPQQDGFVRLWVPVAWPDSHASPAAAHRAERHLILNAYQAASVLASVPGIAPGRLGVVGHGDAAIAALAVAALRPGEVSFMVLLDPRFPVQYPAGGRNLPVFAAALRCPALIVAGRQTPGAAAVAAGLGQYLRGPHQVVWFEGQSAPSAALGPSLLAACRQWMEEALAWSASDATAALGEEADLLAEDPGFVPALPVDLSAQ